MILASMSGLAACSNNASKTNKHVHLSQTYTAPGKATKAGNKSTLRIANISSSPFSGVASPALQTTAQDVDMFQPGGAGALFNQNKHYQIIKGGLASLKLNKKNNTATVTLRKGAKWSNGMKITAKDVEYPYEIIANKKSKSQQYSTDMNDIKGMAAYHAGKTNKISGITFPDGPKGRKTLFHFNRLIPALKYNGNSTMWDSVEPYEYLKNIPLDQIQSSSKARKHPIFTGPYRLKKEVQGESTNWEPNPYYWGKKPHIKHINIQIVSPSNLSAALKAKKYDFAFGSPATQYPRIKSLKDYSEVGTPELGYSVIGFDLGHLNKSGTSVMDPKSEMANPNLRKAMLYSLNLNEIAKKFGHGLSYRANTLIPPIYGKYHASYKSQPGFPYNMKKARKLLKDTGYKKRNGSKYLSQPNGKKLIIHYGAPQGSAEDDAQDNYFLQQWRKLGLDAKFTNGRPLEFNSLVATLLKPKQNSINIYRIEFGLNAEPTPIGFFGDQSNFNMGHFVSKENNKLMAEMNNKKSFKMPYRIKIFKKWQRYMNKQAAYAPEFFNITWTPVNHRLKGYSLSPADNYLWSNLELTAKSPK